MRQGRSRAPTIVIAAWAVWLAYGAPAVAQEEPRFSLTVSPLLVELQGQPGQTLPFDISVANPDTGRPARFSVSVAALRQDLSGNYRIAPDGSEERSAAPWIKVSPESFSLEPGKSQLVRGELTFPRTFRGGAYAGVVLTLQPEEGPAEGPRQVIRNEFVVVVEAVAVTPGVRPDMHINNLVVLPASQKGLEMYAQQYGPRALLFVAEVVNEGNVHGFVSGTLSIWDAAGRKLQQIPLGSGRGAVLPGSTVRVGSILTKGLPPGEYTLQGVINYGGLRPAVTRKKFALAEDVVQQAQGGRGVRIAADPETLSFEMTPGSSRFAALRIQNLDKVPVTVAARVLPLVYDAAGNPNVEETPEQPSSAAWAALRPTTVTIPPGSARNLQVGMRVPRNAPAGGHYAQVVLTARPRDAQEAGSVETELSIPLHTLLGRDLPRAGELSPLTVQDTPDGQFLIVSTTFTNTGKVHVTPSAEVVLEMKTLPASSSETEFVGDPIWVEVSRLNVPPTTTPVLPGGIRHLGALLQKPPTPGEYRVRVFVRFGAQTPLVGELRMAVAPGEPVRELSSPPQPPESKTG